MMSIVWVFDERIYNNNNKAILVLLLYQPRVGTWHKFLVSIAKRKKRKKKNI